MMFFIHMEMTAGTIQDRPLARCRTLYCFSGPTVYIVHVLYHNAFDCQGDTYICRYSQTSHCRMWKQHFDNDLQPQQHRLLTAKAGSGTPAHCTFGVVEFMTNDIRSAKRQSQGQSTHTHPRCLYVPSRKNLYREWQYKC